MGLSKEDKEMLPKIIGALGTGLFAAQAVGLIRFPGAPDEGWTIGEIDSKLTWVVNAFILKAEELDNDRRG